MMKTIVIITTLLVVEIINYAAGHGRLMDPPARNSMWRYGFPNPVNYNDNELYCGGWAVQWEQNNGKCGICGDPYQAEQPRPHEAGGLYAKGLIGRHYSSGQEIDIEIELTTNHYGHFEFFLCPNNNAAQEATQECFDRFPLYVAGTNDVKYIIPEDGTKKAIFQYRLVLPPYVTCTQCVMQWTYYTGNQWGECKNGTEAQGCGKSEVFKNCADVSILTSAAAAVPPLFVDENSVAYVLFYKNSIKSEPYSLSPLVVRNQVCVPHPQFKIIPKMNEWCQTNCLRYPPNCPSQLCHCPTTCNAVGELRGQNGADTYCMDKCIVYPSKCPLQKCDCYEDHGANFF